MRVFTATSATMQNISIAYKHNLWAFSPPQTPAGVTRLRNVCDQMYVGDIFLLYCSEIHSLVLAGHLCNEPMYNTRIIDLWDGEFHHPLPIRFWTAPKTIHKDQFLAEMPLFKRRGTTKNWWFTLNLVPNNFANPCNMDMADLCYLIDAFGADLADEQLQAVFDYQSPARKTAGNQKPVRPIAPVKKRPGWIEDFQQLRQHASANAGPA